MSSVPLPKQFSELEKAEAWPDVEASFSGAQAPGEYRIEANGLFLWVTPKAQLPSFFIFVGNYTPMQDPAKPSVYLQHMQLPLIRHELTFRDAGTRDEFTTYFFKCLAALEAFIQSANMLDYCRGEPVHGLLPGETSAVMIMCVLQSNGKDSVLQGHVVEKGKVRPGFSHDVAKTTGVDPVISVPDPLKEVANVMERAIVVTDTSKRDGPDLVLVCANREAMMGWVVSVYMASVNVAKKVPRKEDEAPQKLSYAACLSAVEDEPAAKILAKHGVDPSVVKCGFIDDMANVERQATLLALFFANGIKNRDRFKEAVEKLGCKTCDGTFEAQVSHFVSTNISEMKHILSKIAANDDWQLDFYELGALIRFPGLCTSVASALQTSCEPCDTLLDNLSFEDETHYLRAPWFTFLSLVPSSSQHLIKSILALFEDRLTHPDLKMTQGPWAFITDYVNSGAATDSLAQTYKWITSTKIYDKQRTCPSKLEELIHSGLEKRCLCDWLRELASCETELENYYEPDATLRDPSKLAFVTAFIENTPL